MTQHYSDPSRASDPYSLPDLEVFYVEENEIESDDGGYLDKGWYWWSCFPGCLPDCLDPMGPYDSEAEALAAAQDIE